MPVADRCVKPFARPCSSSGAGGCPMISLDKLTVKSQEALQDSVRIASEAGHAQVEPEHLFVALLRQEGGVATDLFARAG
ncbi:MAG: Clp protease N-terminal domain-containing protein, partial [Candidatus Deferrimicrobiaceae bacterium]